MAKTHRTAERIDTQMTHTPTLPSLPRLRATGALALVALLAAAAMADVTVEASCVQKGGWMPGGWGSYRLVVTNPGAWPVTAQRFRAHWEVAGEAFGDPWEETIDKEVAAAGEATFEWWGYLPQELVDKATPAPPLLVGSLFVDDSGTIRELACAVEIPPAYLPEPLLSIDGEHITLDLMESRVTGLAKGAETVAALDAIYDAMGELTGGWPYDGRTIHLREAPENIAWAYAGETIILNTLFVEETLKDCDEGLLSFGWTHEMGHDFDDPMGDWYIWNGPAAEWQANFKLHYAWEQIPGARTRWSHAARDYPMPGKGTIIPAREYGDRFFSVFGDAYLSDPSKDWEDMSSDDIHAFAIRLQRVYGWELWKSWYRAYRLLKAEGRTPPTTPEGKINLMVAILSREAKVDLTPAFRRWRFPVTAESVAEARAAYGL